VSEILLVAGAKVIFCRRKISTYKKQCSAHTNGIPSKHQLKPPLQWMSATNYGRICRAYSPHDINQHAASWVQNQQSITNTLDFPDGRSFACKSHMDKRLFPPFRCCCSGAILQWLSFWTFRFKWNRSLLQWNLRITMAMESMHW